MMKKSPLTRPLFVDKKSILWIPNTDWATNHIKYFTRHPVHPFELPWVDNTPKTSRKPRNTSDYSLGKKGSRYHTSKIERERRRWCLVDRNTEFDPLGWAEAQIFRTYFSSAILFVGGKGGPQSVLRLLEALRADDCDRVRLFLSGQLDPMELHGPWEIKPSEFYHFNNSQNELLPFKGYDFIFNPSE